MPEEADARVSAVLASGSLAHGQHVREFEHGLAQFLGAPNLVSAGDVSTALAMTLYEFGVGPGSEVVTSPLACLSTTMPIRQLFARARWCDIDPDTGSMCALDLERVINHHTRAILVYHWAGNPAELAPIYEIARRFELPVIEDCGEALGATVGGQWLGAHPADAAVFSFYPNRHLTTGEGAAISFAREPDAIRARRLRRYSIDQSSFRDEDGEISPDCDIPELGFNTYLSNVSAAIGVAQLPYLRRVISRHCAYGVFFVEALAGVSGVTLLRRARESRSAYWVYTLRAERADDLMRKLRCAGISSSRVHFRNDRYSAFDRFGDPLPGIEAFARTAISIPCGWWVTDEMREEIRDRIVEGW
jgi:dTDP-4-amino-4,6-dideoxygalactose transaminase